MRNDRKETSRCSSDATFFLGFALAMGIAAAWSRSAGHEIDSGANLQVTPSSFAPT
jgi:hypothetical protein